MMNHNVPVEESSLHHQTSRALKEKVLPSGGNRSMAVQDKGRSLKFGKFIEHVVSDKYPTPTPGKVDVGNSVPHPFVNCRKPWPSRKVTGVEEVVKNMSNVPCYLQHTEKGDNIQEKALNFGVLDWSHLERWTYIQKQAENRKNGKSSSSSIASSSSSMLGSSSQSGGSIDSPLAQRKQSNSRLAQKKQSPTFDAHWDSFAEVRHTKITGEQKSKQVLGFCESRASQNNTSIGHNSEKCKSRDSDMEDIPQIMSQPLGVSHSPSASKGYDTSHIGRSVEAEKIPCCEEKCCPDNFHSTEDWRHDQCLVVDGVRSLQGSVHESHISSGSTIFSDSMPVEVDQNSFSANSLDDIQFTNICPHIPHPCPLRSASLCDKLADASTALSENEVPANVSKRKHEMLSLFGTSSSEKHSASMANRSEKKGEKAAVVPQSELSPHSLQTAGRNWMRSSSSREGPLGQQVDNFHEAKEASNSRSRRSPLRRMLDPLLKSKSRIHFSGPIASSSCHQAHEPVNTDAPPKCIELKSAKGLRKLANANIDTPTSHLTDFGSSVIDGRRVTSTGQALLKLAWKNGLPLFMFSSNGNNILAATIGKRSISGKNDFECIYTMFTANEVKKKSGIWISQGNKNKKHGLVYNVIGQLRVSSSQIASSSSKNYSVREFVLFGVELIAASHECTGPFNSELAAIVIKVQNGRLGSSNSNALQSSNCRDSSQLSSAEDKGFCCQEESLHVKQYLENLSVFSVATIIPSGVHGLSSKAGPSPLIERWKSGGSCDCGGWDEGCKLTVLTDKVQKSKSSCSAEAHSTTYGTHQIELFIQGATRENRPSFSMVSFTEGIYTVDFGAALTSLQAFAISIATIHSREPTKFSDLHNSMEAQSLQEHAFADYTRMASEKISRGAPTSYVPDHPPLSPIGRA